MPASVRKLLEQRRRLLSQLSRLSLLIRGSWFERFSTCSRPQCRCHQGQRHGPRAYVTVTLSGQQKQLYVPSDQLDAVRRGVGQYQRLLHILDRVSAINLQLLRKGKLHEPKR